MKYPYDLAGKKVEAALWFLERFEWSWEVMLPLIFSQSFFKSKRLAGKCNALIAHDRILTGEILSRGLPSFYGDAK